MSGRVAEASVEATEMRLLVEGIYERYGLDFREYSPASLTRRVQGFLSLSRLQTVSALQDRVLHDPKEMTSLLFALTVNVTTMFRDAGMYKVLRGQVIPALADGRFLRVWLAGCSTGEEAYSLAILLSEEGLYDNARIYATDLNEEVLEKARSGIFRLERMKEFTANHIAAGGKRAFSDYYAARYGSAVLSPELKRNIVFAQHDLVTDASFNEFGIILCRNVLIYFNKSLQDRVHRLLYSSLSVGGYLCLGAKEAISFTPFHDCYEEVDHRYRVFRKVR